MLPISSKRLIFKHKKGAEIVLFHPSFRSWRTHTVDKTIALHRYCYIVPQGSGIDIGNQCRCHCLSSLLYILTAKFEWQRRFQ